MAPPRLPALLALLAAPRLGSGANVLVVYHSEQNHTQTLAGAIAEGARGAGATVRLLRTEDATYAHDVKEWADGILVGGPVHNGNIAAPLKEWIDKWDYVHDHFEDKVAAPFTTGGHLYGGIESVLKDLRDFFGTFAIRVVPGEKAFQPMYPNGVGATTFDPPFDKYQNVSGYVDNIFLDAGRLLGARIANEAEIIVLNKQEKQRRQRGASPVFVTEADQPEQFGLASALLTARNGSGVIAGVVNATSANAAALARMGAELREVPDPVPPSVFRGADWMFLIPPNDATRLRRGEALVAAATAAGVRNALLLSVVGVDSGAPEAASLAPYLALERRLAREFPGGYAALRTTFYQQNLNFWAKDCQGDGGVLRLPFSRCFAPLYMGDVAAVVAALATSRDLPERFDRKALNLTGPGVYDGAQLAAVASAAVGATITYKEEDRATAEKMLDGLGILGPLSEVDILLDILAASSVCTASTDVRDVTGQGATDVSRFFADNAAAFAPQ